ncbi:hypothetical protein O6H91_09G001500 [Diphasiastrum complanatum]|uniref:Uncharacterized protein n=1 Tax=Diphasiastrum complanatum TaxID=34168 RepID=A0ACC2CL11_DIPCM|nr:hypothetical protein O6H91_09G001500 [Diphasiastrum complanatum]
MDNNWRATLAQDSRTKIVRRIMDTLQKHMPVSGHEGMSELYKIALRFEEKIFQTATDQQDYLRKISVKMLSLETKAQGGLNNPPAASSGTAGQAPVKQPDPGIRFSKT